jgi:hypothetical protein
MKRPGDVPAETSSDNEVTDFLAKMKAMGPAPGAGGERGRLIFAMDATMSRQPAWDRALQIQAEMFAETAKVGGLDVQLVYFRGFGECRSSKWVSDPTALARLMTGMQCRGGHTQIGKVLAHIRKEAAARKINAVVYVGDCMEEKIDELCAKAGEIGILGVPIFMFQDGREPVAEQAFREIARLTKGAYCRFDHGSARQLRELLAAVAVYAAGGRQALADLSRGKGGEATLLLEQLK